MYQMQVVYFQFLIELNMSTESTPEIGTNEDAVVADSRGWLWGVVRTLRPHQWVKNVFVLAPLFFAQLFWEWQLVVQALIAALLFSLMAGTVYLINDIVDREKDRRHPTKRNRPIASGQLSVSRARAAALVLGTGSLIAGLLLNIGFGVVLLVYLVMNLAYSKILKEWAFVDVSVIAIGFVLRVLAGGLAVGVFLSEWLVLCTFLLACFLGLGKRRHEVAMYRAGVVEKTRKVLGRYRLENLDVALFFVAGLTIAGYTIYTLTAALPDQPLRTQNTPFDSPYLPATIPLVVMGLARFYYLAQADTPMSPTEGMLKDRVLLATVLGWVMMLVVMGLI